MFVSVKQMLNRFVLSVKGIPWIRDKLEATGITFDLTHDL